MGGSSALLLFILIAVLCHVCFYHFVIYIISQRTYIMYVMHYAPNCTSRKYSYVEVACATWKPGKIECVEEEGGGEAKI